MDNDANVRMEDQLALENPILPDIQEHKVHLQSRCVLHKLDRLLNLLGDEQNEVVRQFCFGGLLQARSYSLRMALVEDLIACFDPKDRIIDFARESIKTYDIAQQRLLLGLPADGPEVESKLARGGVPGANFPVERAMLTLGTLYTTLTEAANGEEFRKMLLLYTIATIIRPTSNNYVSSIYLSLLPYIDAVRNLNWAEVRTYKCGQSKAAKNKRIGGCI
ncbi:hypothetical protein J5N97_028159 [Dioscorea zingiberensis]|uniref:Uncharacterized protein n=1 Tax=Dioscorea zingiberensis TaxID=325984 RepID=A0A9D5BY06_9LILI|nr:hypothetical protein J5N97_028159 [Dioscorea zingiberensis]